MRANQPIEEAFVELDDVAEVATHAVRGHPLRSRSEVLVTDRHKQRERLPQPSDIHSNQGQLPLSHSSGCHCAGDPFGAVIYSGNIGGCRSDSSGE